jgi:hypothetical protein
MSEVKVNKISPRTNCGTTTLGDSGDTFTIPAGVSITNNGTASGFGATGAASWNTTVKTGDFTAVAGEGYFVNTTSGAVNVTLPAGTAGAVIAIKDYAGTFDTNNVTLTRNGSDKIGGQAINATLSTEGTAITLVFIDSTQGWLVTDSGLQSEVPTEQFIEATGGTITTVCTNFKVHTFTSPGTFTVTNAGNSAGSNTVSYLTIAGGGGGGSGQGSGAGGAGGFRESKASSDSYTASPIAASGGLAVPVAAYPITIGGGGNAGPGAGENGRGSDGTNSVFSSITSAGGGGGGSGGGGANPTGANGGSGGGAGGRSGGAGGSGNTPPVSPPQGQNGGTAASATSPPNVDSGGGGGGAGAAGNVGTSSSTGGAGGVGSTTSINATPTARAGGGGGGSESGGGGAGGGGGGGNGAGGPSANACNGATNTGGGGGGKGADPPNAGNGGSGIVIIRYKFQ